MKVPLSKLKAIILYFAHNTDGKFLGKVKLMKLLYFLDFMHVKRYGAPVTYDNYVNLEHGPIPSTILNLVNAADDDIDNSFLADTIAFEHPKGIDMCRIVARRPFTEKDQDLFSKNELETLERVCLRFGDKNTKFIEDASHKEAPWNMTSNLSQIPYTLAAEDNDCQVKKEAIELALSF